MLIGKNWKVESIPLNVVLYRRRVSKSKDGKPSHEYWSAEGYYSTTQNALKALVDLEVTETDLKDLKTIVKKQEELYRLIDSIK